MCQSLQVNPSGYYAWKLQPQSARAKDDQRLLGLLKQAWLESGGVYGYRKLMLDMRKRPANPGSPRPMIRRRRVSSDAARARRCGWPCAWAVA